MSSRQFKWALLMLAVSGLAGGALGSWVFSGQAAYGEEDQSVPEQPAPVEARFHKISLTSADGKVVCTLVGEEYGLTLYDVNGRKRMILDMDYMDMGKGLTGMSTVSLCDGTGEVGLSLCTHPLGGAITVFTKDIQGAKTGYVSVGDNSLGLGTQAALTFGLSGKGIGIHDADGGLQVALNGNKGGGDVVVFGLSGEQRVLLHGDDERAVLVATMGEEQATAGMSASKEQALVALCRPGSDKIRAWIDADESGSGIGLAGPIGEEQIQLSGTKDGGCIAMAEWQALKLTAYSNTEVGVTDRLIRTSCAALTLPSGLNLIVDTRTQPAWDVYLGNGQFACPDREVRAAYQEAVEPIIRYTHAFFPEIADKDIQIDFFMHNSEVGSWQGGKMTLEGEE